MNNFFLKLYPCMHTQGHIQQAKGKIFPGILRGWDGLCKGLCEHATFQDHSPHVQRGMHEM